jgi:RNA polymerase sigma factor (sigma-70 family)
MALTTSAHRIVETYRMSADDEIPEQYWELVEQYRMELLEQAKSIVGNAADAEDVVQETFSEAFKHTEKLANAKSLGAWLRAINRANAMDYLRDRRSQSGKAERKHNQAPARAYTTGGMSAVEIHDSIALAIEGLPQNLRTIVVLHYWQHMTCEQIAESQKMPAGTVKWLLAEGALRLHAKLKQIMETGLHRPIQDNPKNTDNPAQ